MASAMSRLEFLNYVDCAPIWGVHELKRTKWLFMKNSLLMDVLDREGHGTKMLVVVEDYTEVYLLRRFLRRRHIRSFGHHSYMERPSRRRAWTRFRRANPTRTIMVAEHDTLPPGNQWSGLYLFVRDLPARLEDHVELLAKVDRSTTVLFSSRRETPMVRDLRYILSVHDQALPDWLSSEEDADDRGVYEPGYDSDPAWDQENQRPAGSDIEAQQSAARQLRQQHALQEAAEWDALEVEEDHALAEVNGN